MDEANEEGGWERVDWDSAEEHPMVAGGLQIVVRGTAPVPTTVEFYDLPIGIAPEDYQGVEVRGRVEEPTAEVETPWMLERDSRRMPHGNVGFVLVGKTKQAYFPPKDA
jgi:hypothetical protein